MKKNIKILVFLFLVFISFTKITKADDTFVDLTIRDGDNVIFSESVVLQPEGEIKINDTLGNPHTINARSVLSVINDADQLSSNFAISNLIYYESFNSLYLKCITSSSGEKCDNWQYVVDGENPQTGMDQFILSGGESIYLYFGLPHKVILSASEITTTEVLTVSAKDYDYENNAWEILTGVTIGITQPDPNNPFNPIEIKTSPVDENGQANFTIEQAGEYDVGIKEDFYFPTEELTVTLEEPSGGGSGNNSNNSNTLEPIEKKEPKPSFDLKKAFEFLISQQKENGSFGEDIYTDWTAIALGSTFYHQDQRIKLTDYLKNKKLTGTLLTDYERRAMAFMSLGVNPYDVNGENYIGKIIGAFDGKQFGDKEEYNDDIFALIVLQNANYSQNESAIKNGISFIISKQKENGSWGDSVDMTGAGIEALSFLKENREIKEVLERAKDFLKQNQKDDGGFGNVSSTAWALQGIMALNEKPETWIKNENSPIDFLVKNQDKDGGLKNENIENKIWETAYVTTSLSGNTWNQIMQKFEAPSLTENKIKNSVIKQKTKEVAPEETTTKSENLGSMNTASALEATRGLKINTDQTEKESKFRKIFYRLLEIIF